MRDEARLRICEDISSVDLEALMAGVEVPCGAATSAIGGGGGGGGGAGDGVE